MSAVPVPEITLTCSQVSQAIGLCHSILAGGEFVISGICTDSRLTKPGHLFFCLQGENFDGHNFIQQAINSGAVAVVLTESLVNLELLTSTYSNVCFFPVVDTLRALGDLAGWWLKQLDPKVIAVTGSNGKTTTREMVSSVLSRKWEVHCNRDNLNNLIGVPLTIFEVKAHHQIVVLEMGMNCPGEIARLAEISRPHGVVLTNVAAAHLEGLGSFDEVVRAKSEIFSGLRDEGYIIYNADDRRLAELVSRAVERNQTWEVVPVSLDSRSDSGLRVDDIVTVADGMRFVLKTDSQVQPVVLPLWGRHNVMNALLAATVGWREGLSLEEVSRGLYNVLLPVGRLSAHVLASGRVVIDDSYNANPASMEASLHTLNEMCAGRYRVAILGDMFELGEDAERLHAQVGTAVALTQPDLLITYGSRSLVLARSSIAGGMPETAVISFIPGEEDDLLHALHERLVAEHVILVKGSRGMGMEKLVERLLAEEVNS
jgi:UDP-N-acetylmuramoyl-tripeptide--D-alanyl-D-alanine ligase